MPSLLSVGMEDTASGQQTCDPLKKYCSNVEERESTILGTSDQSGKSGKFSVGLPPSKSTSSTGNSFNIKEEIYSYVILCCDGKSSSEMLKQVVTKWVEQDSCSGSTNSVYGQYFSDFAACIHCQAFLCDPVTIPCGHTYCKTCLEKLPSKKCLKCGKSHQHLNISALKTNVVIAELMGKWWTEELQSVQLRNEGNCLFKKNQIDVAVEKYIQASNLASNKDHLLASNRSHAHLNLGQAVQALQYAEATIKLRPDWPKGYYRKGSALLSLGRYEDAAISFLQCVYLDPHLPSVINELTKVLHRIITMSCCLNRSYANTGKHAGLESGHQVSTTTFGARRPKRRSPFGSRGDQYNNSSDEDEGDGIVIDESTTKRKHKNVLPGTLEICDKLNRFLDRCQVNLELLKKIEMKKVERFVDPSLLDKNDFECTLCLRLLWQPVTTPCGHIFCRVCLDRCLDHMPRCPLCKSPLDDYLAERRQFITEFVDVAMQAFLPKEYAERKQNHQEEMNELTSCVAGSKCEIPIFVCTVGFPTVPCPLHVFEPRYRLMIRRCLESGLRKFGICTNEEGSHDAFVDYGTMLEIRDVQYFPDGRAVVDTVGRERFRVLQREVRDGYHTATVEFLSDQTDDEHETRRLHDVVHVEVLKWFDELNRSLKNRILEHFGPMPDTEANYGQSADGPAWVWWALAILPLDSRAQLSILSMTSLRKRLEALHRILTYVLKKPS